MTDTTADGRPNPRVVVTVLGFLQILAWGSTFYLLAVLAPAIVADTGWTTDWVIAGVSVGLLVAGIVSPRVGRLIGAKGGRLPLAVGAALMGLGLLLLGTAQNYVWYLAAWLVIGAGMGAGLYDAAFATLGSIYGRDARNAIASVTLFGGFASTVCWPITALLIEYAGWRGACFAYAFVFIGVALPGYLLILPRRSFLAPAADTVLAPQVRLAGQELWLFVLLAAVITIAAAILSMMGNLILLLLQARGLDLAAAVALGALIGPSAVGARMVERFAGNQYHPIWTMIASTLLVASGVLLFLFEFRFIALGVIGYAAGNGIGTIAKGTLPLALFGAARYPALVGRLGLPVMVAMAAAPFAGAVAYRLGGADWTLLILTALALTNVGLVALLFVLSRRARTA
ncbi:MAG: MFS transporter [Pseudolabrys sp.]|nr:MFS transporter [Pseudolabrys sp.]